MPVSHTEFGDRTTGDAVVSAFKDIVKDKVILITGANPGGIGGSTAVSLAAASPKLLILAGRNDAKLSETIENVKEANASVACRPLKLDLSSQESCRKAAKEIMDDSNIPQIDILINNAGIMNLPDRTLSTEGIEMQFATNHVGHFLFTNLLYPKIAQAAKKSAPGATRIVNLSSRAVFYGPVRFSDYNFTKREAELPEAERMSKQVQLMWETNQDVPYSPQGAYGQSKTANVLFSVGSNQRWLEKDGILSIAVHPGGITTELGRHMDPVELQNALEKFKKASPDFHMKNLEEGCSTTLVAALDPKVTKGDIFFADCQVAGWAPEYSTNPEKAEQLWKLSEQLVKQNFTY